MQDLNDLQAFAVVVQHGGFSAAARALGVGKSSLSKRVARLEAGYEARLIERSTRAFRLTTVGERVHAQCEVIFAGVEAAQAAATEASSAPRGVVRVACPPGMMRDLVSAAIPRFLAAWPLVRLSLSIASRRVDLVEDGFDVAIRVRDRLEPEQDFVVRRLGISRRLLVASPGHLAQRPPLTTVADLVDGPLLTQGDRTGRDRWLLKNSEGREETVTFIPRLEVSDFHVLYEAALAGAGVALISEWVARESLAAGQLVEVLPGWRPAESIVHLVFTSRRGMPRATRAFIDFLSDDLPPRL